MIACFLTEALATFFFLFIIIGTTSKGSATGFAGIPIGLALALIHLVTIPITNTSMNPARGTGPALECFPRQGRCVPPPTSPCPLRPWGRIG